VAAQETASLNRNDADVITREELEDTGAVETSSALTLARSDLFSGVDGGVLLHGLPVLTLIDGRPFATSPQLGRLAAFNVPVAFVNAVEAQSGSPSLRHGTDAAGGVVNLRLNRIESGGEVGVFYGRSSGKYGQEHFSTYIMGGVGNDKFNITAGAYYHESSGTFPRGRR
jgi:outer membrane receptor protein involved in Fe transport